MVEQVQEALSERALQEVKEVFVPGMVAAASALSAILGRQAAIGVEGVRQGDLAALCADDVSELLAFRIGEESQSALCGAALFPRRDVQRMLGLLMGGEGGDGEGMPFDEMNLSAACEVVSQMLDAAAAVLESYAEQRVILTAFQGAEVGTFADLAALLPAGAGLVSLDCWQRVGDVLEGPFQCLLPAALCRQFAAPKPAPAPPAAPQPAPEAPGQPAPAPEAPSAQTQVSARRAQFPDFADRSGAVEALSTLNASLLMGVPLEVSIVIGRARRKIRDILEFGTGTVIDLDKQTGAPAEIIVNGQLLAYGDVIVIGDNYGVRITEIVGTKELLDSLEDR